MWLKIKSTKKQGFTLFAENENSEKSDKYCQNLTVSKRKIENSEKSEAFFFSS